ncbi:PAS domain-containing sensor histidine kinase [Pyxidicoccus sp. MSG2]|uniref:PAS domain-containing sensor histidine kinase n=1 Tax=Pyxidicoccus sp. MSG2 TaxID=2996790 RepID=UPI0022703D57|nr:PAS domain-containing sensor histidine kinase [Pyxidicoccus sp. MSG2]MCY1017287.1 ATP-binding protein [Pyxidicoccus sp. MSG2]
MADIQPAPAGPPASGPPDGHETARELSQVWREHEELIDSIDGIVWEADPSFRFTLVSKQAERLLGYPVRRWYEEPDFWVEHLHPDDREWAASYCREAAEQCLPHEFEYRMLAADGQVVWLRDLVTVMTDPDGRPARLRGIMVDVTAQRGTQEHLERTVALLEATLESTADGLLVVGLDGRIRACNRRFHQIWELDMTQVGTRDAPLLREVRGKLKDPEGFMARVQALYDTPWEESFDTVELRDGRTVERYSLPQRQRGVITGRVWSFRDVSARVQAEREREQLLRDANEAIQVRDDFLSIASHELKTPLTPLRLNLQLLKQALESDQPVTPGRVDKALGQVRRLSALVNDLLDASCVGEGRMELQRMPMSLPELVREVFSDFRAVSDAQHPLTYEGPEEDVLIQGDRGRLSQVLTNLLENALKYSPLGGAVRVSLTHSGGDAVVTVADSGIGIPKEELAHLFERFFRARNAPVSGFGGLGLGLYICRDIIDRHGGHIWVESELGRGSAFHVSLPVLATRMQQEERV